MSSIVNKVLFGLKVSFNFSDIESKATALQSLGLDIRDLEVIRGISSSINKIDLQNVSGLDTNLTRYLNRLSADTSRYRNLVNNLAGFNYATKGNLEAYGPVSGGAVRYKYIPNDGGVGQNASNLKYGDISTSRVSSWSSATSDETNLTQAISYGGSVQVKGVLKIGQNSGFTPDNSECLLNVLDTPEPIRFATEVATDVIELNVNQSGVVSKQYVYAMRGIPFIFTTAFKTISMTFAFSPFTVGGVQQVPIYTFKATDDSEPEIVSVPSGNNNVSNLYYGAQSYKERDIRVYYPPNNITSITGTNINLRHLPAAKFLYLQSININYNLLGEMPDWRNINYEYYPTQGNLPPATGIFSQSLSDGSTNYTTPRSTLTYIDIHYNPLYLSEDEELIKFGTNVMERIPRLLTALHIHGTYREDSDFLVASESLVLFARVQSLSGSWANISDTEYNTVKIDPDATQTYCFSMAGDNISVKGKFYDKQTWDNFHYIYVDKPTVKYGVNFSTDTPSGGTEVTASNAPPSGYAFGKQGYLQALDIRTRCPKLQSFYMGRVGNEHLYQTSSSAYPDYLNSYQYTSGTEIAPRVNIKNIVNYYIRSNGFRVLPDDFSNPDVYLHGNDSDLEYFDVYDNDSLTAVGNNLDFTKMTKIKRIDIGDTSVPIPQGLTGKTQLSSVNCVYSRFPGRNPNVTILPNGGGNPSGANNYFYNTPNPADLNGYVFKDCGNLSSFAFYAANMDGFFPKLIGNGSLSSIDLRNTSIEGGRPESTENGQYHGRRWIMWNDTFEDAQNITTIRIRSSVLGRNIGTFDTATQTWSGAAFQGATFNLPLLSVLEILCPEERIRGEFFDPSQAPSLQEIISYSTGWGKDIPGGTQFPSFAGNSVIRYVRLEDNNFSGNVQLSNHSNLQEFYASQNDLTAITVFTSLPALEYLSVSSNPNLGPDLPNFSQGSPNIKNIGCNNCNFTNYIDGSFSTCTRIRSVDLSNNNFNTLIIDTILSDLVDNYNAAPRGGVIFNMMGNAPPSKIPVSIPTQTTSKIQEETISVDQNQFTEAGYFNTVNYDPDGIPNSGDEYSEQVWVPTPQDPQYIFYLVTANIRDGFDPPSQTTNEYETRVFLDGVDITSNGTISIDYAGDVITFTGNSAGAVVNYPPHGSTIKVEVWQTVYGTRTEYTGGIVLKNFLTARGWLVRTD